ncbi:MAG TPA: hypothetical protein VMV23_09410 [Candidatus Nanopelagicaceae bacterium]|nr:hypothetical protein [Candidatus Nanopelagicaceae bacterium]
MADTALLQAEVLDAQPCPHPAAAQKAKIVVSDGDTHTALCMACYSAMKHLVERAEMGQRPELPEVSSTMVALGYTPMDAERFWEDLP